jgi:hypothetical protein
MVRHFVSALALVVVSATSQAAVLELSYGPRTHLTDSFFHPTANGQSLGGLIDLQAEVRATVRIDDEAHQGTFLSASVTHNLLGKPGGRRQIRISPPNSPYPEYVTLEEYLYVDPLVMSEPVAFVSSSTGHQWGYTDSLQCAPLVTFSFPDSFTVSGSYGVRGPSESIGAPFSVKFNRVEATPEVSGFAYATVYFGAHYPGTATLALDTQNGGAQAYYQPEVTTLFEGVVNGVPCKATLSTAKMLSISRAPEPASLSLAAVAAIAAATCTHARRRSRRRTTPATDASSELLGDPRFVVPGNAGALHSRKDDS